jgi:hypothetical protein
MTECCTARSTRCTSSLVKINQAATEEKAVDRGGAGAGAGAEAGAGAGAEGETNEQAELYRQVSQSRARKLGMCL